MGDIDFINPYLLFHSEEERRRACSMIGDFEEICGQNSNPLNLP